MRVCHDGATRHKRRQERCRLCGNTAARGQRSRRSGDTAAKGQHGRRGALSVADCMPPYPLNLSLVLLGPDGGGSRMPGILRQHNADARSRGISDIRKLRRCRGNRQAWTDLAGVVLFPGRGLDSNGHVIVQVHGRMMLLLTKQPAPQHQNLDQVSGRLISRTYIQRPWSGLPHDDATCGVFRAGLRETARRTCGLL